MDPNELTPQERGLIAPVTAGELLDLAPDIPDEDITLKVMSHWSEKHRIRGGVIRDILRGVHLSRLTTLIPRLG